MIIFTPNHTPSTWAVLSCCSPACLGVVSMLLTLLSQLNAANNEDPLTAGVRSSDPLSPAQQLQMFDLPPGFQIELVAAEPSIAKPMNMAFDTRGRLWVSDTLEYPYPVGVDEKGRDSIKVLTDTNGDGTFDQITTFAEGLNIPIGLYPYRNGVLAWSIPNIWWLEDTDGDGKADLKERRYGPLGWERDTHGMNASFTRGYDGWLYATHGFNNNTTIQGQDGSELFMNSGHTYRIRLDGSRVEPHTFGQVNPFGMTLDPLGNFYTADCHSAPIYQLLRGAYYPSFGKPHDGLGYGPSLMEHAHGSTAICGIVYYDDVLWPTQYRDNIFIGNVMTSRLNRDVLLARGSSRKAVEMPDLIVSRDPWFRPVDIQLGPDGALYVADFYNRIIGHYEVPLDHPGRDRERGRLWKITYSSQPGHQNSGYPLPDFTQQDYAATLDELGHPNLTRRLLALNFLSDEANAEVVDLIRSRWADGLMENWKQRALSLWLLHRLGQLDPAMLADAVHDTALEVRLHAMLIMGEEPILSAEQLRWLRLALQDAHPSVQRAAAHALSLHPAIDSIAPLLMRLHSQQDQDPQLRHGLRLSLRNQFLADGAWYKVKNSGLSESYRDLLIDVAPGVQSEGAAQFLVECMLHEPGQLIELNSIHLKHIAKHASKSSIDQLVAQIRVTNKKSPLDQLVVFKTLSESMQSRSILLSPMMQLWGEEIALRAIEDAEQALAGWSTMPLATEPESPDPWMIQKRTSSDGDKEGLFWCSLPPNGESYTGALISARFEAPQSIEFYLAGHQGYPDQEANEKNVVRLVDAESGDVLVSAHPPRQDIAQRVQWDCSAWLGRLVAIEMIDGDTGDAYAWLAMGRLKGLPFKIPSVSPRSLEEQLQSTINLGGEISLEPVYPTLERWARGQAPTAAIKVLAARHLGERRGQHWSPLLAPLLIDPSLPEETRHLLAEIMLDGNEVNHVQQVGEQIKWLPLAQHQKIASLLSQKLQGLEIMSHWIQEGDLSPYILQKREILTRVKELSQESWSQALMPLIDQIPDARGELEARMKQIVARHRERGGDAEKGALIFEQACVMCHQIDRHGAVVGPQLDGVGSRGAERLIEDVMDPHRNVDKSFQMTRLIYANGDVEGGLLAREEDGQLFLIQSNGEEKPVQRSLVASIEPTARSLMPDNFGELFTDKQWADLLAFLLGKR